MDKVIIYTDGGARGNPGPAGIGAVIYNERKKIIAEISEYIGGATNNQAEYKALIAAFRKAVDLGAKELDCYLDSELIVKQLKGEYRVKDKDLALLFLDIHNLSLSFKKISYTHIPREKNEAADRLVNEALDREVGQRN
ncbi:MAG: ribonuclease HI family protein [bacterium]|nr:ribonuclease HI family protein [bacterium]